MVVARYIACAVFPTIDAHNQPSMKYTHGRIKGGHGFRDLWLVKAPAYNLMPEHPVMEVFGVVPEGILVLFHLYTLLYLKLYYHIECSK